MNYFLSFAAAAFLLMTDPARAGEQQPDPNKLSQPIAASANVRDINPQIGPPRRYSAGATKDFLSYRGPMGPPRRYASGPTAEETKVSLTGPPRRYAVGPSAQYVSTSYSGPLTRWANGD
jgi:hypothetical protein